MARERSLGSHDTLFPERNSFTGEYSQITRGGAGGGWGREGGVLILFGLAFRVL